jgi:secondary thiamine-phosphate synthase enzyme
MTSFPNVVESVRTDQRSQVVDVTTQVQKILVKRGVNDGMVIIYIPHTTAGVTINENYDPDVKHDVLATLDALVPKDERFYKHAEGNSDAHVKTAMVGNSVTVLIESGRLVLGQWQGIWFCEFDGPRERQMFVKVVEFSPGR